MTQPVVDVEFGIDMSNYGIMVNAMEIPVSQSGAFIRLRCDKTLFFGPSGLYYSVATDSSGYVTTVSGLAQDNIQYDHVQSRASGAFSSWQNTVVAGDVFETGFSYLGISKACNLSLATSSSLLPGETNFGQLVAFILTTAVQIRNPSSTTDVFDESERDKISAEANERIVMAIKTALSSEICQNEILKAIMNANGPVIQTTSEPNSVETFYLPYTSNFTDLILIIELQNIPFVIQTYGHERLIVLSRVPLQIHLTT